MKTLPDDVCIKKRGGWSKSEPSSNVGLCLILRRSKVWLSDEATSGIRCGTAGGVSSRGGDKDVRKPKKIVSGAKQ